MENQCATKRKNSFEFLHPKSHSKWNENVELQYFQENDDDGDADDDGDEIKCAHGNRTYVTTILW